MSASAACPPRDHVLLIGIDAYSGCPPLRGCVNDIDAVQRVLIDRLGVAGTDIRRLASPLSGTVHPVDEGVTERQATLAAIREELARLGSDEVEEQDRVFIYHAGHGTQVRVVEPGTGTIHTREALLPRDHVVDLTPQFLFDWELNGLLAGIAARTRQVVFVLDACCSRGATRGELDGARHQARWVDIRDPYVPPPDSPPPPARGERGVKGGLLATVQTCQVIASCQDDELARESDDTHGVRHGELTRALVRRLEELPAEALRELRWGRIWYSVYADVAAANPAQHPWISGGLARRVFGGPPEDAHAGYSVTRDGDIYRLQVGSLFGVTPGAELQVYGSEPPKLPDVGSDEDRALRPHHIVVTSATPSTAEAESTGDLFEPDPGARARLVKAGEAARLRVGISPPSAAIEDLLLPSPLLALAPALDESDVALVQRRDGAWALVDGVFGTGEAPDEPWLAVVRPAQLGSLRRLVEHYYWYSMPLRVAKACTDLPRALHLGVHDARDAAALSASDAQNPDRLPELPPGTGAPTVLAVGDTGDKGAQVCFVVRNRSALPLDVTLLACNNSGFVDSLSQKTIPASGAHVFWSGDTLKSPFPITRLPGRSTCVDRLVAIGTTDRGAPLAHLEVLDSFEEVTRGTTREIPRPRRPQTLPLWTAAVATLRLIPR